MVERPLLAARDLTYRHPGGRGVEAVELAVGAGELVGVLGPNGAGKSTLVRLLSGVLVPERGEVELLGASLASLSPRERARRLAVVPQEPAIELPFTALELVLLGRHPHLAGFAFESDADLDRARAALARTGVDALAGRDVATLSSGERQRVILARALAQEAPVLLADEPASFLDLRHQVETFDLLRDLADAGRAVAVVLHDLNLAAEYCDRVVLLREGRVFATGPAAATLTYANLTHVYDTEIYVDLNDLTGALVVTALSRRARARLAGSRAPRAEPPPDGALNSAAMLLCRFGPEGFFAAGESFDSMQVLFPDPLTTPPSQWTFGRRVDLALEALRAPIEPGKVVGIGRSYREHARELDNPVPAEPVLFLKSPGAVVGPNSPIVLPPESARVEHEGEIAVVLRHRLRRASALDAARAVLGVTAGNDVTARDLQRRDPSFCRAKSFDTFCPLGPAIAIEPDLDALSVVTRVNGEERQRGHAGEMIWPIVEMLVYASRMMTLEPGDVVLTGTPAGVGPLADGDTVEVEVPGAGVLRSPVEAWRQ